MGHNQEAISCIIMKFLSAKEEPIDGEYYILHPVEYNSHKILLTKIMPGDFSLFQISPTNAQYSFEETLTVFGSWRKNKNMLEIIENEGGPKWILDQCHEGHVLS